MRNGSVLRVARARINAPSRDMIRSIARSRDRRRSTPAETKRSWTPAVQLVKTSAVATRSGSLVLATSESNYAKLHSIDSLPIMVAGTAGGKWRSGLHINGKGEPSSRIGLTIQQALGMPVGSWGVGAMATSKPITEVA